MNNKDAKSKILSKLLLVDKYSIFKTAAVTFLVAAAVMVVLFFGYMKNNDKALINLLEQTAIQKAKDLSCVLELELLHLENLEQNSYDDAYGLIDKVYVRNDESSEEDYDDVAVDEQGTLELCVKSKTDNGFICAKVSGSELATIVDNGAFYGSSSVILYEVHSGNVVVNTADKHGFHGNKIGFLLNHEYAHNFHATSMFSDIDDKKNGYTEIYSDNEKYSVCYVDVNKGDLYLFVIVPRKILYSDVTNSIFTIILVTFFVIAVILTILFVIMGAIKVNDDVRRREFFFDVIKTALVKLSEDDYAGIYIYQKGNDELEIIKDINSEKSNITLQKGFEYLVAKTGIDESDRRKLKNTINLAGPGKDMRINVDAKIDNDKVVLQMMFSCIKKPSKNKSALVCVVRKSNSVQDITNNIEHNLSYDSFNTTCIELFLERNMWHFLWNNEPAFEKTKFGVRMNNDYDAQLKNGILQCIKQQDREKVLSMLDRLNLLESYRNGVFERTVTFSMPDADGRYSHRQLEVRMYRDNYNEEIKANFYIRNLPDDKAQSTE